ncbi:MAG: class I SAM-dependent methyltransferase [Parahaliea sp.]
MAAPASDDFATPFGTFRLTRYPTRPGEPLQAWCAADELLLQAAAGGLAGPGGPTLVMNDEHGALALPLAAAASWTDSALAALALAVNARTNGRPAPQRLWSTEPPPPLRRVFLRIPKHLAFFEFQLAGLARSLPEGATVVAGGMDKHLSPHSAALMERHLGPTERHRGERKARLFSARLLATAQTRATADEDANWIAYHCRPLGASLRALPNVFSRDRLDGGSELLLGQLGELGRDLAVTDLACGNGVLGLAALAGGLAKSLLFCDESAMAMASARDNLLRLYPQQVAQCHFHHGDGLRHYRGPPVDLVLCNPPFHQQHTVDDFAGRRLLQQAARHLQPGGRLCLVANRHLNYRGALKRAFGRVSQLAGDHRFSVWLAEHPRQPGSEQHSL